jgi:acyl-CoA reductase-like NAD-dependent aldehyde dehydrogenase
LINDQSSARNAKFGAAMSGAVALTSSQAKPPRFQMYLGGQWCDPANGNYRSVQSPHSARVVAEIAEAGTADVHRAIYAASAAKETWANQAPSAREGLLWAAAAELQRRREEFADILIEEGGSTALKAAYEVGQALHFLRGAAGECRRVTGETLASDKPGLISLTIRRPRGVVACILPFNFPLLLGCKKVGLALAAGNTVVVKPSPHTSAVGLMMAQLFDAVGFPAGSVNVLSADGAMFADIVARHPLVAMINFTGSTAVGRQLAAKAGEHLKKVSLELGGKSPVIVLRDADLDYATDAAIFGSMMHQGQICMAGTRLIVEKPIYEVLCSRLVAKANGLKRGDPRDPAVVVGPLINAAKSQWLGEQVDQAVAGGASLLAGGRRNGAVYEPTVLGDVRSSMPVFNQELFGPVLCVAQAADEQEAIALANSTSYGLSAAVITENLQAAFRVGLALRSGMVHLNHASVHDESNGPFGGTGDSGLGREGGRYSIEEMTELTWVTVQVGHRKFPF